MSERIEHLPNGQAEIAGTERLLTYLDAFGEGVETTRQEIEAAIEQVLRDFEPGGSCYYRHQQGETDECNDCTAYRLAAAVRLALNDPHGALAEHDDQIRSEHLDDLIERLRSTETSSE